MNRWFQVDVFDACGGVEVLDDHTIGDTAPFFKRWRGQPFGRLLRWVQKHGGTVVELTQEEQEIVRHAQASQSHSQGI